MRTRANWKGSREKCEACDTIFTSIHSLSARMVMVRLSRCREGPLILGYMQ